MPTVKLTIINACCDPVKFYLTSLTTDYFPTEKHLEGKLGMVATDVACGLSYHIFSTKQFCVCAICRKS